MASEVKTNKVSPSTGTTLSVGDSGDTLALATDAVTGFQVGSDAAGDVLYHDGTDYTRLAKPGTPADEVLTFATGDSAPTWVAAAAVANVPQFSVYVAATWAVSDNTWSLTPYDTADVNDDGASGTCFNLTASGTNPRGFTVPAGEAGKYLLCYTVNHYVISGAMEAQKVSIYKGTTGVSATEYIGNNWYDDASVSDYVALSASVIVDAAVGDHYYIYSNITCGDSAGRVMGERKYSNFSGFKLT